MLHREVEHLLFRAVCEWAGILPLDDEAGRRAREISAMIDGAGAVGPRFMRGMLLRSRTEQWASRIIAAVRNGRFDVREGSAAQLISQFRDIDGKLLDTDTAAVELINVLRPTVAVARYITFAAHALEAHPAWKARLQNSDEALIEAFVQEVRRFYPFFPMVGGRALEAFAWHGHFFRQGAWVLLDLYGTNHDARIWTDPEQFEPERFLNWEGNPYTLIPQGGGDFYSGHRCPGEWITIELTKQAVRMLSTEIVYRVPLQDLRIRLSRLPAIPESGLLIKDVRRASQTWRAMPHSAGYDAGRRANSMHGA